MQPYEAFNIPTSCAIGNVIPKKHFYANYNFSTSDKKLFASINKIYWLYSLKPATINIPPYKDEERDYPEIEFLEVVLSCDTNLRRIAEIIMRAIPYPMVLIFRLEQKVQIWTAHQRLNQADSSKNTLEDFVFTQWLEPTDLLFSRLDIRNMRFTNYFDLYTDLVDEISIYNAECATGENSLTGEEARELTRKIDMLERQLASVRAALKKESQFNKKVELNIKIKQLESTKLSLLQGGSI